MLITSGRLRALESQFIRVNLSLSLAQFQCSFELLIRFLPCLPMEPSEVVIATLINQEHLP